MISKKGSSDSELGKAISEQVSIKIKVNGERSNWSWNMKQTHTE